MSDNLAHLLAALRMANERAERWEQRRDEKADELARFREGVAALENLWRVMAEGSASSAVAREGLSDTASLLDHSATMTRRANELRALLDRAT